jgi:hypothetical protein
VVDDAAGPLRDTVIVLTDEERSDLVRRATAEPAYHRPGVATVYHYSEDGGIRRFAPHVPPTNPSHPPAVWAIDEDHSPLYWFPRHCPRISVWANTPEQQQRLTERFATEASRIVAAEIGWLDRIREAHLYRYAFDGAQFEPWAEADGQYITGETVHPVRVDLIDDLLALHAAAEVELRLTPRLGELMDQVLASGLPFSFVRIRDAQR